jgi:hypothetical protein
MVLELAVSALVGIAALALFVHLHSRRDIHEHKETERKRIQFGASKFASPQLREHGAQPVHAKVHLSGVGADPQPVPLLNQPKAADPEEVVTKALMLLGVTYPGERPSKAMLADGVMRLDDMAASDRGNAYKLAQNIGNVYGRNLMGSAGAQNIGNVYGRNLMGSAGMQEAALAGQAQMSAAYKASYNRAYDIWQNTFTSGREE